MTVTHFSYRPLPMAPNMWGFFLSKDAVEDSGIAPVMGAAVKDEMVQEMSRAVTAVPLRYKHTTPFLGLETFLQPFIKATCKSLCLLA